MSLEIFPSYPRIRAEQIDGIEALLPEADPVNYGAKADGTTDDYPALLACAQAVANSHKIVDGRNRTYYIVPPDTPNWPSGVVLRNAKLLIPNKFFLMGNIEATFVNVEFNFMGTGLGVRIEGNNAALRMYDCVITDTDQINPNWVTGDGISFPGKGQEAILVRCRISGVKNGIHLHDTRRVHIEGCTIHSLENGVKYIAYTGPSDLITIKNNYIVSGRMPIEVWGGGAPDDSIKHVVVSENVCIAGDDPEAFGISVVVGKSAFVNNNYVFYKNGIGIEAYGEIIGNTVVNPTTNGANISVHYRRYARIIGNRTEGGNTGIVLLNAGYLDYCTIAHNAIINPYELGIFLIEPSNTNGVSIHGNQIYRRLGAYSSEVANWTGIAVPGSALGISIIGNVISVEGSGSTSLIGIRNNANKKSVVIMGNIIRMPSGTPIFYNSADDTRLYTIEVGNILSPTPSSRAPVFISHENDRTHLGVWVDSRINLPPSPPPGSIAVISNPEPGKSHIVFYYNGAWRYIDGTVVSS